MKIKESSGCLKGENKKIEFKKICDFFLNSKKRLFKQLIIKNYKRSSNFLSFLFITTKTKPVNISQKNNMKVTKTNKYISMKHSGMNAF